MPLIRRVVFVLAAALVAASLSWPTVAKAEGTAECGGRTCVITDTDPGSQTGGNGGGKGGGGAPVIPECGNYPAAQSDPPPDPTGWVQIACMEGNLEILLWVEGAVNPEQIARSLLARLNLDPVDIGMVPREGARSMGVVGLPVWMWVDNPSRTTWGPATINAGNMSLTARVQKVVWEMGDGTKVTCGKGAEWTSAEGTKESPNCGHIYEKQGRYTVRATSYWEADWAGYSRSGTIPFTLSTTRQLPIGEIQVIATR